MLNISFDFGFFMKLVFYILLPIIMVVIVGLFLIKSYSKKVSEKDTIIYHYTMDYCASLLAMIIVGILFAIVSGFAISFTHTMRIKDIISGNEMIYYIFMFLPVIPLIFLLYYLRKFIVASFGRKRVLKGENYEEGEE